MKMELDQVLQRFRQQFQQATHVKSVLKERPLVISFELVEGHTYLLKLTRDDVEFLFENEEVRFDVIIRGSIEAASYVLNGKERLQRLQKQNKLTVKGSYSAILKAETIFYLNH